MRLFKKKAKTKMSAIYYQKGVFDAIKHMILQSQHDISGDNVYKVWNVYAIVSDIAQNVAKLPYVHYAKKENDDPVEIENKTSQLFMYKPNPLDSATMFRKRIVFDVIICGNAYILVTGLFNPQEMKVLRASKVKPIQGVDGLISKYEYDEEGRVVEIPAEEIIHIRTLNPASQIEGMSAIEAARSIINLQESSIKWNQSLMDNQGKPEGAWVAEIESEVQRKELAKMVSEAKRDYDSKGGDLVLGAGLDYKQFSLTPKDVDWILSDKQAMRKICAVLRYPSQLLGDTDAQTYSNIREMEKRLFNDTIIPYGEEINDSFNHFFYPDRRHYFSIDKNKIEQIQTNIVDRANAIKGLPAIRVDDALKGMGFEPIGDENGGNTILVATNYMPLDQTIGDFDIPPKGEE